MPALSLDGLIAPLKTCGGDLIPMWAAIAVVLGFSRGRPANSCAYASYQLAGALGHLGYDAEPVAASVQVSSVDGLSTDVGVWKHAPRIRRNGTTDGHVVVWTSSFRRMIDLTIGQDPQLQRAARQNSQLALPVVGQVDELLAFREWCAVRTERPPFTFTYRLLPQYTPVLAPLWENPDVTEQLDHAALAIAYDALDLVRATESRRRRATGIKIRALLDGKAQLPPWPTAA